MAAVSGIAHRRTKMTIRFLRSRSPFMHFTANALRYGAWCSCWNDARAKSPKGSVTFSADLIQKPKRKPVVVVPKVSPIVAATRGEAPQKKVNDPCPACKSTCTVPLSGRLHCNACGLDDGQPRPVAEGQC